MHIYIIDNYDSFTYNLYQMVGEILNQEKKQSRIKDFAITVKRNNEASLDEIQNAKPDCIIISPGSGNPADESYFGVCAETIRVLGQTIPLLGVCLGMQGIAHVFGATIKKAALPMHGKTSPITHNQQTLFCGVPKNLEIMRYHSLIVDPQSLPECLEVTATVAQSESFEIMGIQHKLFPIHGIQFHPESFATEGGYDIIRNFMFNT